MVAKRLWLFVILVSLKTSVLVGQPSSGFRHFSWMYQFDSNGQPRRDWYEQSDGSWYEVYQTGGRTHHRVVKSPVYLDGASGKLLENDDNSLYIFVADALQTGTSLYFWRTTDTNLKTPGLLGQITVYSNTAHAWNPQIASINQNLGDTAPASNQSQTNAKVDIDASDAAAFQQKLEMAQREKIDIPKTMHVNDSYKKLCLSGKYDFDGGGGGGAEDSRHACVGLAGYAPPELREQLLLRGCSYPDRVGTGTDPCWQLAQDYEREGRLIEALAAYASPNLVEGGQNQAFINADDGEARVYLKLGNRAKATTTLNDACHIRNDYVDCDQLQQLGQAVNMQDALNRSDAQDAADKAAREAQEASAAQNAADAAAHRAAIISAITSIGASNSSAPVYGGQQTSTISPSGASAATAGGSDSSGSGGGGSYSGPYSIEVEGLLSRSPTAWSCPSSKTERPTAQPIEPSSLPCMRDKYAWAALLEAWAAECHARLGMESEAEQNAQQMMQNVNAAKSMCSSAPAVQNSGPGCSTLQIVPCP